jgi:SAM-dependent methyltransferase
LHFAPEPSLVKDYTQRARKYVRADYDPASDELKIDLQAIDFPNDSFDLIICHNVIEHVPDDRKGLTEMFRVLRPGGVALISAPIVDAWKFTYEDPAVVEAWDRDLHFNQDDHYRIYGRDLYDRIRAAGFELSVDVAEEPDVRRYGLDRGETIFIAVKPLPSL